MTRWKIFHPRVRSPCWFVLVDLAQQNFAVVKSTGSEQTCPGHSSPSTMSHPDCNPIPAHARISIFVKRSAVDKFAGCGLACSFGPSAKAPANKLLTNVYFWSSIVNNMHDSDDCADHVRSFKIVRSAEKVALRLPACIQRSVVDKRDHSPLTYGNAASLAAATRGGNKKGKLEIVHCRKWSEDSIDQYSSHSLYW